MKKYFFVLIIIWCSIASAQNILLNSSFELWLDSVGIRIPFGWYTSEPQDPGTAIRVMDPHTGIYAMQLNGSDTSAYAVTLSICFPGRYYNFSGWCKSNSLIAGTFIITWLKLSSQPVTDPVIIPIYRSTAWRQYTQLLQCPESTALVNVNIVTLPYISITVDDVTLTDTTLSGIEEKHIPFSVDQSTLKIYPNPCNERTQILLNEKSCSLVLYDITGKFIMNINKPTSERINLDTRKLQNGIYFLQSVTEKTTLINKLIVQK